MSTITCPNCDTLLQITLSLDNINTNNDSQNTLLLNSETPNDITDTNDIVNNEDNKDNENNKDKEDEEEVDNVNYELLISKVENDQMLTDEELSTIRIKDMIKTEYYKNLKNKSQIKKKINDMIEDMSNSDANSDCYHFCGNCGFSKKTDNGFVIATRYANSAINENKFFDTDNARNRKKIKIYRRTRQFKCGNGKCPSNNGSPPEAVMKREKGSYRMIYACAYPSCGFIKRL